jgi:two-component system chemotaxis response regulator CheB
MISILIVDDSETETKILKNIFQSELDMEVIGCAKNGKEAVELAATLHPTIITMDVHMPIMDGLEATQLIMAKCPTPIVIISSKLNKDLQTSFKALETGALSVLEKPKDISSAGFAAQKKQIVTMVRNMAEIKVIKRRFLIQRDVKSEAIPISPHVSVPVIPRAKYELVAIGASVGGPQALKMILSAMPQDFPLPIVVVQHMAHGFMTGFSKWLNDNTPLNAKNAEDKEVLKKSTVYFAPDHFHLEVVRLQGELCAHLVKAEPVSGFCPSATVLLKSVAKVCGKNAIGILLTGMGSDGAQGLLELKHARGHTLIQDEKSTVVFGMAGVAKSLGAVDKIVELDQMASYLQQITKIYQ